MLAGRPLALLPGQRVPLSGEAQNSLAFFITAASWVSPGACSREGLLKEAEFSSFSPSQPSPPGLSTKERLLSAHRRKLDQGWPISPPARRPGSDLAAGWFPGTSEYLLRSSIVQETDKIPAQPLTLSELLPVNYTLWENSL